MVVESFPLSPLVISSMMIILTGVGVLVYRYGPGDARMPISARSFPHEIVNLEL